MGRTGLFRTLAQSLRQTIKTVSSTPSSEMGLSALTRRQMLHLTAYGAATFSGLKTSYAQPIAGKPRIAIVGGGLAGLTTAYRLQNAGFSSVIFEASNRWGGRVFTRQNFYQGMFCELGGELVDTRHTDLRSLAAELGVGLQPLKSSNDKSEDLYLIEGRIYRSKDMLDPITRRGAFLPMAQQIARDKSKLLTPTKEWSAHARGLDQISLWEYLQQFRGQTDDWAIALLDVAYRTEFGSDTSEQSCLNMIDMITTDLASDFQIYGDSDEAYRIEGGSSSLADVLVSRCKNTCKLVSGVAITKVEQEGSKLRLGLTSAVDEARQAFDFIVMALPFTRLRSISNLEVLGLSAEKTEAIISLGYGNNAKLSCGTKSRPWREAAAQLPTSSNGSFYSDLPFQCVWETSRGQSGAGGILTNLIAAKQASGNEGVAYQELHSGLLSLSPTVAESLDSQALTSFFWERHPFTGGSYASPKVGQYTTLLEHCATPELQGRMHFVGEHTSSEHLGYMNGAVQSGNRAAAAIAAMIKNT